MARRKVPGDTAMRRVKPSTPARRLKESGLIRGRTLDYGCGRGFDAKWLRAKRYDPVHQPDLPKGKFDTVLCTYVLNTITSYAERMEVLRLVRSLLRKDGRAFISVRRDVRGCRGTSCGWQGNVDVPGAISLWRNSNYEVYVIGK